MGTAETGTSAHLTLRATKSVERPYSGGYLQGRIFPAKAPGNPTRKCPVPEKALLSPVLQLVEERTSKPPVGAGARLSAAIPYSGAYRIRGRWLTERYTGLRNAAWAVRNGRVASHQNPLALALVLAEAERLTKDGEPLWDVLEAFAELLMRP